MLWNLAHDFVLGVLASITASIIGPYDMIGFSVTAIFAFIGIVRWHRARIKEGKRGMDSWYFIAACLVVTALSVAGAAYGIGLRSSTETIAKDEEPQPPKQAPTDLRTGSVLLTSRYYSTKNKEEVGAFLDKISDSINKTGNDILLLAEQAINHSPWDRPGEDVEPYVKRMDEISALTIKMHIALYDELLAGEREYRVEMNSILFPMDPFIRFQTGANEFRNGLAVWMTMNQTSNADRQGLLRLVMASRMTFGDARDKFVAWLSQRLDLIAQTRRALRS